ncbi:hypothetical protein [Cohaesibacter gelatinilyticus]|uniref:Uncharacterized protein n=1 Tax=Cohaesibacter gelatinilyticus TaxID=372072 RepID=A0A285PKF2_9HYPH|nr:hypothetical protein [Cohaesibacter gelatinilyticus]SNZ21747.1 hypothetical protein SAMN06265368_4877 [Cohaesibacter gelatinilyticus]
MSIHYIFYTDLPVEELNKHLRQIEETYSGFFKESFWIGEAIASNSERNQHLEELGINLVATSWFAMQCNKFGSVKSWDTAIDLIRKSLEPNQVIVHDQWFNLV